MFINITNSETGNNKVSCSSLVNYLEKENRLDDRKNKPEFWFNSFSQNFTPQEVRVLIDNNIAKLGRNDAKFFLINISPSQKEIKWLKEQFGAQGAEEQLKAFAINVIDEYARNFKRTGIESNKDLLWYGKLEHFRYYSFTDLDVKKGLKKSGERKGGEQMHIQVIVSRKDITNKIKLSPMNNSRGMNVSHSLKLGQFDRKAFKQSGESLFDNMFGFKRNLKDTMDYNLTMKNGNAEQKRKMVLLELIDNTMNYNNQNRNQMHSFKQNKSLRNIEMQDLIEMLLSSEPLIYENEEEFIHKLKKKKLKKKRL